MGAGGASAAAAGPPDSAAAEALLLRLSETPDALLRESPEIAAAARTAAEGLYAELAAHQTSGAIACPELYTAGFDAEQIWYQIELQLGESLKRVKKTLKTIEKNGSQVELLPGGAAEDDGEGASDDEEEEEEEEEDEGLDGEPGSDFDADADDLDQEDDDEEGDEDGDEDEEDDEDDGEPAARRRPRLPTEDDFFRLEDMERFVGDAEAREARGDGEDEDEEVGPAGDGDDDDDEDDIDLFSAEAGAGGGGGIDAAIALSRSLVDGGGGGGGAGKKDKGGKGAKKGSGASADAGDAGDIFYEDFFGPRGGRRAGAEEAMDDELGGPYGGEDDEGEDWDMVGDGDGDGGDEEEEEDEGEGEERRERGRGAGTSGRKGQLLSDDDEEEGGMQGRKLTPHQKRQAKLQEQIEEIERQNLGDKDWFMRGEVRAGDRPVNSALEVAMDFDHAQMPAPVITEEVTKSLEEIIRGRIVEQRWDDPQRKLPPAPSKAKKLLELSDEKSKKGLAELYEEDYLKQQKEARAAAAGAAGEAAAAAAGLGDNPGEPEEESDLHKEVKALWKALGAKLDSLSHFVYAPKPVLEEMAVRQENVAAITIEEVAPGTASAASLKAPEEVFKGGKVAVVAGGVRGSAAGQLRGKDELSKEERKAARAKKKRKGRAARAEAEGIKAKRRKIADAANAVAEAAGFKAKKELGGATTIGKKGDRSDFAKSSKVFARLQDAKEAGAAAGAAGKKGPAAEKKQPLAGGGSARLKL